MKESKSQMEMLRHLHLIHVRDKIFLGLEFPGQLLGGDHVQGTLHGLAAHQQNVLQRRLASAGLPAATDAKLGEMKKVPRVACFLTCF